MLIADAIGIGDVSGDGKPDLAVATFAGTVSVLYNDGAGAFGTRRDFPTVSATQSVTAVVPATR